MKHWIMALLAAALMVGGGQAMAETEQVQKLEDATTVIRQFVEIPENAIPPALLGEAYGIAVIPSVFKAGFIVGGRRGKGVLSVRMRDGSWSNPSFITLTGGSVGWQIGASSTDIILVFKTQRSIDRIANGQINLGADAAVAAGPVGRSAGASTDINFDAEVYSYSRSRGLFAGVSLEGGRIGIDREANWLFYDQAGIDAYTILRSGDESMLPPAGEQFVYTLDRYMPAADSFDREAATRGTPMEQAPRDDEFSQGQATPYERSGSTSVEIRQGGVDDDSAGADSANPPRNNEAPTGSGDYGSSSGAY